MEAEEAQPMLVDVDTITHQSTPYFPKLIQHRPNQANQCRYNLTPVATLTRLLSH